jgi:hypothetical protein
MHGEGTKGAVVRTSLVTLLLNFTFPGQLFSVLSSNSDWHLELHFLSDEIRRLDNFVRRTLVKSVWEEFAAHHDGHS